MTRKIFQPPIGMRKNWRTTPYEQEYFCPVCDHDIPFSPAYGSWALRPCLTYLQTRYDRHFERNHQPKEGGQP